MGSCRSPWWKRKILYKIPGLFKKCPEGNYHWFWDRLCFCRLCEYTANWHGGIMDFVTGEEYIRYCLTEQGRKESNKNFQNFCDAMEEKVKDCHNLG